MLVIRQPERGTDTSLRGGRALAVACCDGIRSLCWPESEDLHDQASCAASRISSSRLPCRRRPTCGAGPHRTTDTQPARPRPLVGSPRPENVQHPGKPAHERPSARPRLLYIYRLACSWVGTSTTPLLCSTLIWVFIDLFVLNLAWSRPVHIARVIPLAAASMI